MGVNRFFTGAILVLCAQWQQYAAAEIPLETATWPQERACEACVTVQFGVLEMRLPINLFDRIFFTGNSNEVHLVPQGVDAGKHSAVFLSHTRDAYIGKYQAAGLPSAKTMSGEEFFDMLGNASVRNNSMDKIRHVENIDVARRYIKTSKGIVHVYWIQAAPENSQYLHFVLDGSDTIYSIAGAITPQLYSAILQGLAIRTEP